jgi:GAF domain-containing protein
VPATKTDEPGASASTGAERLLNGGGVELLDALTSIAARTLATPAFIVSSGPQQEPFLVSQFGLPLSPAPLRETPVLDSLCSKVAEAVAPLVLEDASRDERLAESDAVRRLGVRGCIGMPLRGDGTFLGLFCVIADRPRVWSDEEVALVSGLAQDAVAEIGDGERSAELVNPLHLRARRAVTEALLGEGVAEKAIPRLVESLCRCLEWDAGSAWMSRSSRTAMRCSGVWFAGSIGLDVFAQLYRDLSREIDGDMLGQVWTQQEPMYVADLSDLRRFPRTATAEAAGFRSGLWLPVLAGSTPLGVIELLGREPRAEDDETALLAGFLSHHIADLLSLRATEDAIARWPRLAERLGSPAPT